MQTKYINVTNVDDIVPELKAVLRKVKPKKKAKTKRRSK